MTSLMTEEEWLAAEEKEPGRVYVVPDYSHAERLERMACAIFGFGALTMLVWAATCALAVS